MMGPMSSRRRSLGRILVVAGLLLLALLLLELERFLPGSWPGGGGDRGSRPFPTGSKPDPARLVPSTTPPPPPKPPAGEPVIRVVLRRADGAAIEGASLRAGAPGREVSVPIEDGEARVPVSVVASAEFVVVGRDGAKVSHGHAPSGGDGTFVVVWPRTAPPPERDGAKLGGAARRVRVEDPDGRAVPGASVTATGRGAERRVETASDGTATFGAEEGVRRVCATAPGFGETCLYARLSADAPLVVRLSPARPRGTSFRDPATGAALGARSLRLVDDRGGVRRLERGDATLDRFDATMPDDVAARTTLEIDVAGRPPVRVPVSALAERTDVPAGVARAVEVRDEAGAPVEGAVVTARFASGPSPEPGGGAPIETTTTTDARGRAVVPLPAGADADVTVEARDLVVAGVHLSAAVADPAAPTEVRTTRGAELRVRVRDERGEAVAGAEVVALAPADRSTARRRVTTDARGEATIAGLRPGPVELMAHRAGYAWASVPATAAPGAEPALVTLKAGKRLALVVEDPSGVPLEGVRVRSVPRADAAAGVPDPSDPDAAPWETDAHGVLVVDDLPDREFDLYLAKAGHAEEVVARVRPGAGTWFATMVPTSK